MSRKTNLLRKRVRQWEERRRRLSDMESALAAEWGIDGFLLREARARKREELELRKN